jgi:hypothetical protein
MDNKLPDTLMGGAVQVVRPTDLRNRIGMYMLEEKGCKIGVPIDPGEVQTMIEEFSRKESSTVRSSALEEAAQIVEDQGLGKEDPRISSMTKVAANIRNLKEAK